jgi:hypothetical protein
MADSRAFFIRVDFRLQLSATDYGNFLANEPLPLSTATIGDKVGCRGGGGGGVMWGADSSGRRRKSLWQSLIIFEPTPWNRWRRLWITLRESTRQHW